MNRNYENLANAVVLQAVEDYKDSAISVFELVNTEDPLSIAARDRKRAKISKLIRRINDAKRFLLSEDLHIYTDIKGTDIVAKLNKDIQTKVSEMKEAMEKQKRETEEFRLGFYSTLDNGLKDLIS